MTHLLIKRDTNPRRSDQHTELQDEELEVEVEVDLPPHRHDTEAKGES